MKEGYKFKPDDHESLVDTFIKFCEDFADMVYSQSWKRKDKLAKYKELEKCFKQFQPFEKAFIAEWNNGYFPFEFWKIDSNVFYMMRNVVKDGKIDPDESVEQLAYHLDWYSDRMNQNRLYIILIKVWDTYGRVAYCSS